MFHYGEAKHFIIVVARAPTLGNTQTMTKNSVRRRKSTPYEVDFQYSNDGIPPKGLIPMMNEMADMLPDDMKPFGKRIVGILNMSVLATLAIFVVGVIIASLTGHSDQITNIFSADIIAVGVATVGAIVLTVKKTL